MDKRDPQPSAGNDQPADNHIQAIAAHYNNARRPHKAPWETLHRTATTHQCRGNRRPKPEVSHWPKEDTGWQQGHILFRVA
jgi:hypothetical protein